MGKLAGLMKRGDGYSLRVSVPKDVRSLYGKSQIWRSLDTKNYQEARVRCLQVRMLIEAEFDQIRSKIKLQKTHPDMLSSYTDYQLERLAVRWFAEKNKKALECKDYSHLSSEDLRDAYVSLQMEYQVYKDEVEGLSKEDVHYGLTAATEYLEQIGLTYSGNSASLFKLGNLFSRALAESCFRSLRYWDSKPYLSLDPMLSDITVPQNIKKVTLKELREEYMTDPAKHRGQSTQKNYIIVFRVLEEMLGQDVFIHEITRDDCKKARALLMRMPSSAQKRAPGKSIQRAIELAEKNGWSRLSTSTINTHLSKLNALLSYAEDEGYILKNHAKNLYVADTVKDKDKRNPFSIQQLQILFNAPLYTGCMNDGAGINTIGDQRPRNAKF